MSPAEQQLRRIAVVFLAAVALHGADHLRRGAGVVTVEVRTAGAVQFVAAVITVVFVYRRHPWAPTMAVAVGLASAVGFGTAHLLPHWSSFSDTYVGSEAGRRVNALSWATAVLEIVADLALAWAAVRVRLERAGTQGGSTLHSPVGATTS